MIRRILWSLFAVGAALFLVAQVVPYRVHNPPVTANAAWDSPATEDFARRACYDCHSNEVKVPWYGHVAPFAWVVRHHVDDARAVLNLSEMDRPQEEAHEASEVLLEGEMPPRYYLALHPEARLSDAERRAFAAGLDATLGSSDEHLARSGEGAQDEHGEHDEDDD